ncbi:ATP-binding cassette domain-containing protein [Oceanotoga sp. DSM 15011]|jgi:ABC-type multidrug transport system ATPase subunit|uniref:ABC-type polar amino acid transport system ATPase subunit n=1 Tax=Oceanotoga teriensis TaxID=515440 RepID=A0AA45C5B4_9BACT|nr:MULTISPECIES: ATP-binding cassette domain-containing protein [Oceanotoga]MDN5343130.1 hypothetical protein [Oceanotoga sp.]MDO7976157.1 ATP-binding cassette domain-containing protein [Oceanotoga teriensis]PWJ88509.1 ABC-type polar amino acid transport system ATPase subunit [Oceanotoga teriensis]UYP00993.1 ATP-binding cassette domain-containing protein [Oceanotoga sp. DSM 15011]
MYYEDPILKLEDFSLNIGNTKILKNLDLDIYPGEIILLYGPRNSGKSSLLRSFVHLNEELYNNVEGVGGIYFLGKSVFDLDRKYLRSQITYSDPTFVENLNFLTLKEILNLSLGLKLKDISKEYFSILEKLGISKIFSDLDNLKEYNSLKNWSIGEKISLITFISLARRPKVFIFDSILDHLDDFLLEDVKDILYRIKEDRTLIISTRNFSLFSDIAERVVFLDDGKISFAGKTESFIINYPK